MADYQATSYEGPPLSHSLSPSVPSCIWVSEYYEEVERVSEYYEGEERVSS